jgi:hypothetical protein
LDTSVTAVAKGPERVAMFFIIFGRAFLTRIMLRPDSGS